MEAQQIAIMQGIEKLDMVTLRMAYDTRMQPVQNFISPQKVKASAGRKKGKEMLEELNAVSKAKENHLIENIPDYLRCIVGKAKEDDLDIIPFLREKGITVYEQMVCP